MNKREKCNQVIGAGKKGWILVLSLVVMVLALPGWGQAADLGTHWISAWSASPVTAENTGISHVGFHNVTIRQVIHPHITGADIRLRMSNAFGTQPVSFGKVTMALQKNGAEIVEGSARSITFNKGQSSITLLPGTEVISDPIGMPISLESNLTISTYVTYPSGPVTWHELSSQTSYISTSGDHTADVQGLGFEKIATSWFWLRGVDVVADEQVKGVLVAFGDSITDGANSTLDENHRFPDFLAERIASEVPNHKLSVLNEGIAGNQILVDNPPAGLKAISRLDHDVLRYADLRGVILLLGINDIGQGNYNVSQIIRGIEQMIQKVHAKKTKIYGATLLPIGKSKYDTPQGRVAREKLNQWVRTSGAFDGVIDFDEVLRDPANRQQLLQQYDCGDHLHPNDVGYQKMATSIDLDMLIR